jgi:hypothetical protein
MKKIISAIALLLFLTGCSNVPYTKGDKIALATFLASETTDLYTTRLCIQAGGQECNPLLPEDPTDSQLLMFKGADIGVHMLLAELFPKHRKLIYGVGSVVRFGISYSNYQESRK